jgi:hypothetical protein
MHIVAVVANLMAVRQFWILQHPSFILVLAPADFFQFPKVKREISG